MDELAARFELLKAELADLQHGIRSYDTIRTQIQGWAVTVGLAAAGLAITAQLSSAALLGLASTISFWIIDGHRRSAQRRLIQRTIDIENALKGSSLIEVLSRESDIDIPGIACYMSAETKPGLARFKRILKEVMRPGTWALYAALGSVLIFTAVVTRW